jgi:Fe-S cluster biogenesis protein NfuA/nitrite reductase/ring-hydroxylating ferredoxin subunit
MQSSQPSIEPNIEVDELVRDVERIAAIFDSWDGSQRNVVYGFRRAIDALHKEAFRKLISEIKPISGGLEALRTAARDPLVYTVLRYYGLVQPSLQERVEAALDKVRPMLAAHGGNVELVAVTGADSIEVRFLGNCDHCPSSTLTFIAGVKQAIEEHCPEITNIKQVKGSAVGPLGLEMLSPFSSKASIDETWVFATPLEAIPDGGIADLDVKGKSLIFSRIGNVVSCFHNSCPHFGYPISGGAILNGRISCPHHEFVFDLVSGECLTVPQVRLTSYPVRMTNNSVDVRLGN